MKQISAATVFLFFLTISSLTGCSSNPVNPVIPAGQPDLSQSASDRQVDGQSRLNLGYSELTIFPDSGEVQIVPLRSAELHLNVVSVLNLTLGIGAVGVPAESDPPNGIFTFDITLTHPFAAKPQLAGFDVKGILITPGSLNVASNTFADVNETRLLNADGYTRWWNPTEFTSPGLFGYVKGKLSPSQANVLTATVNPYKYFADILYPNSSLAAVVSEPLDSDNGRGVFKAGKSNTRRYTIQFEMDPGPKVVYGYAVDASWATPSPNPPSAVPDDFPIEANQPEPWRIGLKEDLNTLYYDSESGTFGGLLKLSASVYDWQGKVLGNIQNEVSAVTLYAPGLLSASFNAAFIEETVDRAVYEADVSGLLDIQGPGDALVICSAVSNDGSTYDQVGQPAPDVQLSAWNVMMVNVADPDCAADANNEFVDYIDFDLNTPITDQLCAPSDFKDYFRFEFNTGFELTGNLVLHCDAEPTRLELYDKNEVKITEADVSGGQAVIDLGVLGLMPDQYYVRVVTQTSGQAFLYYLEFTGTVNDLTPQPESVTPEMLYFSANWVESDANYAYFTGDENFWIFDVDMDLNSQPYSRTRIRSSERPGISYPYACFMYRDIFGSGEMQISIIDMTAPANPVVYENVWSTTNDIHAITMDSQYIYMATTDTTNEIMVILDYGSAPSSPAVVSDSYIMQAVTTSLDMMNPDGPVKFVIGSHAIGFYAYDVTNPSVPHWTIGGFNGQGTQRDLTVQGNLVYTIYSDDTTFVESLWVFEVLDIGGGGYHGTVNLTRDGHYIDARGNYAYMTDDDSTLTVIDITDPNAPVEGTQISVYYHSGYINVLGTNIFIIHPRAGVGLYQGAEDSGGLAIMGDILGINYPGRGIVDGNYIYTAQARNSDAWSVLTIDISDLDNVKLAAYLPLDFQPRGVYKLSNCLVLASQNTDFKTINNNNPLDLQIVDGASAPAGISGTASKGTRIYITDSSDDLLVYNVDFALHPILENTLTTPGDVFGLSVNGNYLYGFGSTTLYIYSIVDPVNPSVVNTLAAPDNIARVVFKDNLMYVLSMNTLQIYDNSDPEAPALISPLPLTNGSSPTALAVDGQFAWVGTNTANTWFCTVWPPDSPVEVGQFSSTPWSTGVWDIMIVGDYYVDFRSPYGMEIMDMYP